MLIKDTMVDAWEADTMQKLFIMIFALAAFEFCCLCLVSSMALAWMQVPVIQLYMYIVGLYPKIMELALFIKSTVALREMVNLQ